MHSYLTGLVFLLSVLTSCSSSECSFGKHGTECEFDCGYCTADTTCDTVSGICLNGCDTGWKAPFCNISYPFLKNAPELKDRNQSSIVIFWKKWIPKTDCGQGTPKFYLVQLRELDSLHTWETQYQISASDWNESNDGFEVVITNVSFATKRLIRVVIVDQSNESQEHLASILEIPPLISMPDKCENNDDCMGLKKLFYDWFMWTGVAILIAVALGLILVLYIECCRPKSNKSTMLIKQVEIRGNNADIPSVTGLVNSGYVTVRSENGRRYTKANMKPSHIPNKVDWSTKDKNRKLSARSNQTVAALYHPGKWRGTYSGRDSRINHPSTCSWNTEWYDSVVYENHREAPEELIVDQTLKPTAT